MIHLIRTGLICLAAVIALTTADHAAALGIDPPLADSKLETRAITLHKQLRCLVCQNQSIHDSNAGLARDLRQIVRERLVAGDSDREVIDYVASRYGDWVLLNPPFKLTTAALWVAPVALILVGGVAVMVFLRRSSRQSATSATPLSDAERARLDRLLEGDG